MNLLLNQSLKFSTFTKLLTISAMADFLHKMLNWNGSTTSRKHYIGFIHDTWLQSKHLSAIIAMSPFKAMPLLLQLYFY